MHVQCNVQGDIPIEIKWKIQNTQQHLDESMDSRYGKGDSIGKWQQQQNQFYLSVNSEFISN